MKRYPAYKDSGVKWLGEVPTSWKLRRFKEFLAERAERSTSGDETLLSVSAYTGVTPRSDNLEDGEFLTRAESLVGYKVCYENDLVMNIMLAWNRAQGITQHAGIVSPAYAVFACDETVYPNYLNYLVRSDNYCVYFKAHSAGVIDSRLRLYPDAFLTLGCIFPPLPEQHAIAEFLDRETAKIDALVEEQRRLIALLAEKRQAVISHAVTRGLNPDAPLKPSGIDWLGDIPEGWEVVPLKFVTSHVVDCLHTTPHYDGEVQYPAVRTADIVRGRLLMDDVRLVSEEVYVERIQRLKPEKDDILYSREGERLGLAALVPPGVDLCLGQRMMMFRCKSQHCSEFVMWALNSEPIYQQVMERNVGATSPHANIGDVVNFRVVLPDFEEQQRTASWVTSTADEIDALTAAATSAITLLQERRAALISAAVTGKIDVREAVAPVAVPRQSLRVSAMVAGFVIARYGRQPGHGRVWLQKMLFMAQTHANINEIDGHFLREPAGPLDRDLRDRVEADLTAANAIRVTREQGAREAYHYEFLGDAALMRADLSAALGARMEGFQRLTERLGDLNTKGIEAVATLYAAWNDLLIDGQTPSDSDITHEVLEHWHPEKSKKFSADELNTWLAWMRRQDIVPSGTGQKTYTGRLFI